MSKKNFILIFTVFIFLFSSCVSKKKFLEMQTGRLTAEELSRKLSGENSAKAERIKALIADFEQMKNELLESNAIKDSYIDSLNGKVNLLTENLNQQKESLQETSFTLDFEKQRLEEALSSKDRTITTLQSEVLDLEKEVSSKSSLVDQKNFDLQRAKDENTVLEGKVKTEVDKLEALQTQLNKVKTETDKLKKQLTEKDAEILKLNNNVKLLKSELGK